MQQDTGHLPAHEIQPKHPFLNGQKNIENRTEQKILPGIDRPVPRIRIRRDQLRQAFEMRRRNQIGNLIGTRAVEKGRIKNA